MNDQDLVVLSGGYKPASLHVGRIPAVQALEAALRAAGNVAEARGNPAIRLFIENSNPSPLVWGKYRLDLVQLPKESK